MEKVLQQLTAELATLRREVNRLKLMEVPAVTAWTDWTPTVNQNGAVNKTVDFARYIVIQNLVVIQAHLSITGTGSAGTVILIQDLPFDVANATETSQVLGSWILRDASVPTNYAGTVQLNTATAFAMRVNDTAGTGIGQSPSLGLASGDTIGFIVAYERA